MADVEVVAVVGADEDACAVARAAALAGLAVRLYHPDPTALDEALGRIRGAVEAGVAAGSLSRADRQRALDGVLATSDLDEALTQADAVLDVAAAPLAARRALLSAVGEACRASTLVATVAAPDDFAAALANPGRLVGVTVSPTIGVHGSAATSASALARARSLAARLERARALAAGGPRR